MKVFRRWLAAVLMSVVVVPVWADENGLPSDEWQAVFANNTRVGYSHQTSIRDGDLIVSSTETRVTVRRFGAEVTTATMTVFRERADGTPVSFETVSKTADMLDVRTEGRWRGERLDLVVTQGESRQEKTVEWNPDALPPYALTKAMEALSLEPGTEATLLACSPEVSPTEPVEYVLKVIGPDTVDVLGVEHDAVKIEMRLPQYPGYMWVDSAGDFLVLEMPKTKVRIVRCTKEEALAEVEILDIGHTIFVSADKLILFPRQLRRLVVRLSTKDGAPFPLDIDSLGHQRVLERDEQSVTLEISPALVKTDEDTTPYLARSTVLDCTDERIIAAARAAIGDETDPWRQAQALRRAVYELIEKKTMAVVMATASEVIESKEGDCSEHAVLLAAMARAVGIPSRMAMGLVSLGHAFGYHVWTQVYIDGAWRDVDATLPKRDFDATHIRLAASAMSDEDLRLDVDAYGAIFGNLKIEILEMDYGKPDRTD